MDIFKKTLVYVIKTLVYVIKTLVCYKTLVVFVPADSLFKSPSVHTHGTTT